MKIKVKYATVEVYQDSYNEGELGWCNSWELYGIAGREFDNIEDLIKAINQADFIFSDNKENYIYIDGRIDTDAFVNNENFEPTAGEIEAWKKGEIMLYNARLMVGICLVPDKYEFDFTAADAEKYGIEVY